MDNTSLDTGLNDRSSSFSLVFLNLFGIPSFGEAGFILFVATCIIIGLGVPLTLGAIFGLCSQVRNGEVAPIYIINLLMSDLIQFICMIIEVAPPREWGIDFEPFVIYLVFSYIYNYMLMVSVGLMVCITLERYLVIVHPLWYHSRRTIKTSVMICIPVWILPLPLVLTEFFSSSTVYTVTFLIFFLLPLPLLLFFMVATLKALSASISVPTDEKRRIAGMLILVLLIYLLLILPGIIWFVYFHFSPYPIFIYALQILHMAPMFLKLSPLADLLLYIILRKGTIRQLSACVCCCRKQSDETSAVTVSTVTMSTVPSCQLIQRNTERGGERTEEV